MGEPVKKPILGVGRFGGLNREYSVEYSIGSARLGCGAVYGSARQGNILGNILRRGWRLGARLGSANCLEARLGANMARVWTTRLQPLGASAARGQTVQNLQVARVGYLRLRAS